MNTSTDSSGRLTRMPQSLARMVGGAVLISISTQYSYTKTEAGLIIPGADDDFAEKKYRIGEVIARGPDVPDAIQVGDILVYLTAAAYRMPNGHDAPNLYKITVSDMSVMAVLPNLVAERRHESWDAVDLSQLDPEIAQWESGNETPSKD